MHVTFRPVLVGDSAYPMSPFCSKAFLESQAGSAKRNTFDRCIRQARVNIDNAFGQARIRRRILKSLNVGMEDACTVFAAFCIIIVS